MLLLHFSFHQASTARTSLSIGKVHLRTFEVPNYGCEVRLDIFENPPMSFNFLFLMNKNPLRHWDTLGVSSFYHENVIFNMFKDAAN